MNTDFLKNKTILLTGATGLIGSNLVDRLMDVEGIHVIAVGRNKEKLDNTFLKYLGNKKLTVIAHDMSKSLPSFDKDIDIIYHAAGPMEGNIIRNYPVDVVLPNINGIINCLDLLRKQKKDGKKNGRLVVFSSVTVYNNITNRDIDVCEEDTNISECLGSASISYSESKRMSEVIADSYTKQFDIDVVKARFSTVYGFTKNIPDTAFYEFIKKGINGEDIILNSDGTKRRDNIFIEDAITGLITITENGIKGEAYNISSNGELGNYASVDEIASKIVHFSNLSYGYNMKLRFKNNIGTRAVGLKLDNSKLKSLGWKITTSLDQGILKTMNYYKL